MAIHIEEAVEVEHALNGAAGAQTPEGALRLDDLLAELRSYLPADEAAVVRRAYNMAAAAHDGQFRRSGEPFVQHPLAVALELAKLRLDCATVAAGLLHDVPEDTALTLGEIEARFGKEITLLVDGVTKLTRIAWETLEEEQAENLRKMFLAMAQDIRVVLVKLCDRLHNIRTLEPFSIERRRRIAQETLEIYAPLAHRLGIWELKWRLEDGAFYYLDYERYQELKRLLAMRRETRERYVHHALALLSDELAALNLAAKVSGRPKHLYSIHRKMLRKNVPFEEVYDLLAVRVLVDSEADCYAALGVVHRLWTPIPGEFDDYIARAKPNMYRSLHTAVIGPAGQPLEVQIRTQEMHKVAEYGIAAHWRYKEGRPQINEEFDVKLAWFRQLMAWQGEVGAEDFVEALKTDIFQDQVFVFTPRGDIKEMPAGAIPLDFAYRIHTDLGHRYAGARVNSRLVALEYQLQNGDIVEILTGRPDRGPSRDWLNVVGTAHARSKIRQWFKRQQREENAARGRELVAKELQRLGLPELSSIEPEALAAAASELRVASVETLFAVVGYGGLSPHQVVSKFGLQVPEVETPQILGTPSSPPTAGVTVSGVGDLFTRIARCCNPVPGDSIVGFITRGRGLTVHRHNCPNVQSTAERERLIDVEWGATHQQVYPITLRVESGDRPGLARDVTTIVAEDKINIVDLRVTTESGAATFFVTVEVTDVNQLVRLIQRIERIKDVSHVARDTSFTTATGNGEVVSVQEGVVANRPR